MHLLTILIWCALGYVGGRIAAHKGYPLGVGIATGIVLGPFALAVFALLPMTEAGRELAETERQIRQDAEDRDRRKECPQCGRIVSISCRVCPRCGHHFAQDGTK